MKNKLIAIASILLLISFIATYITGLLAEESHAYSEVHETMSFITMALVVVHVIGYWRIIKNYPKIFKK